MALRGIQEYIARDVNNIARVEDEGNIVNIEGNKEPSNTGPAEATQHWGGLTIDVTPPPQSRSQKHYLGVNIGGAEAPLAPPLFRRPC